MTLPVLTQHEMDVIEAAVMLRDDARRQGRHLPLTLAVSQARDIVGDQRIVSGQRERVSASLLAGVAPAVKVNGGKRD